MRTEDLASVKNKKKNENNVPNAKFRFKSTKTNGCKKNGDSKC